MKKGEIITDPKKILDTLNKYYERLFTDRVGEVDPDYLALIDIPRIKEKDKYWIDGEICLEEIHLALKSMKKNKCPGTDGLPMEFYDKFWPIIATTMHKLFQTIVQRGELNRSAKESITSLMGKTDRDPLMIPNWRPLSLLNTDYKLYAKVLARRMQTPSEYLIDPDQKGFMKNRSIADNLLNLLTVVEFCQINGVDALLLVMDFNAAFDSCSWTAIRTTLNAYGYGQKFIDMVLICYKDIKTTVMNNNYWSNWIKPQSGVKQGCPLSGILFDYVISIIALKIKQNGNIKGIQVPNCNP